MGDTCSLEICVSILMIGCVIPSVSKLVTLLVLFQLIQGKTLVTEGMTLVTKGKTLMTEGRTLVTKGKTLLTEQKSCHGSDKKQTGWA